MNEVIQEGRNNYFLPGIKKRREKKQTRTKQNSCNRNRGNVLEH